MRFTGRPLIASASLGRDDARVRRAQARLADSESGLELARWLLESKLRGQAALAARLDAHSAERLINEQLERCGSASSLRQMRAAEAAAAVAYWDSWTDVRVFFPRADHPKVPSHWHTFGRRRSHLGPSPRMATNPANALLNYLYGLLEAAARLGVNAVGLDPGFGVIHSDYQSRDWS